MGSKTVEWKTYKTGLQAPLFCQVVMKNIYRLKEENSPSQGVWVHFLGLAEKMFITHTRLKF